MCVLCVSTHMCLSVAREQLCWESKGWLSHLHSRPFTFWVITQVFFPLFMSCIETFEVIVMVLYRDPRKEAEHGDMIHGVSPNQRSYDLEWDNLMSRTFHVWVSMFYSTYSCDNPEWHILVESRNIPSSLTENNSYYNLLHIRLMRVIPLFFIVAMLTEIINFS